MFSKNNRVMSEKKTANEQQRFSLRKLSIGTVSVMVGALLFMGATTSASADQVTNEATATTATTDQATTQSSATTLKTSATSSASASTSAASSSAADSSAASSSATYASATTTSATSQAASSAASSTAVAESAATSEATSASATSATTSANSTSATSSATTADLTSATSATNVSALLTSLAVNTSATTTSDSDYEIGSVVASNSNISTDGYSVESEWWTPSLRTDSSSAQWTWSGRFNYDQTEGRITFGVIGLDEIRRENSANQVNGKDVWEIAFSTNKTGDGKVWATFYDEDGNQVGQEEVPTDDENGITAAGYKITALDGMLSYNKTSSDVGPVEQLFSWAGVRAPYGSRWVGDKIVIPRKVTMKAYYLDADGNTLGYVAITGLAGQTFTAPLQGIYTSADGTLQSEKVDQAGLTVSGNIVTGKISEYARGAVKYSSLSNTTYTAVPGSVSDYYSTMPSITDGYVNEKTGTLKDEATRAALETSTTARYQGTVKIVVAGDADSTLYVDINDPYYHLLRNKGQYERNVFSGGTAAPEYIFDDTEQASQTVTYTGAGSATPVANTQKASFVKTYDTTTGESTWNEDSHTFNDVKTPVVTGYYADQATVAGATVTPANPTSTTTVTYQKLGSMIPVDENGNALTNADGTGFAVQYNNDSSDATKAAETKLAESYTVTLADGSKVTYKLKDSGTNVFTPTENLGTDHEVTYVPAAEATVTVEFRDEDTNELIKLPTKQYMTYKVTGSEGASADVNIPLRAATVEKFMPQYQSYYVKDNGGLTLSSDNMTILQMKDGATIVVNMSTKSAAETSVNITYKDEGGNDLSKYNSTVNGKSGYSTKTGIGDTLGKLSDQGYELVGVTQNGTKLTNYKNVVLADENPDIEVVVRHQQVTETTNKTVTRTIKVIDPTTGDAKITTQPVTLTHTVTTDKVTGKVLTDTWATGEWSQFTTPEIDGYTPTIKVVAKTPVTNTTTDQTVTIYYSKNQAKQGTLQVQYVDADTNQQLNAYTKNLKDDAGKDVNTDIDSTLAKLAAFGYDTSTATITQGTTNLKNNHATVNLKEGTNTPIVVKVGHKLTTVTPTDPKTTKDPLPDNADKTYPKGVGQSDLNKTVTRTVTVVQPDGTKKTETFNVTLTRTATVDEVTGKVASYSAWSEGSWNNYAVPTIDGYTAKIALVTTAEDGTTASSTPTAINAETVTSKTPNEAYTVTYTANPTTPTEDHTLTVNYVDQNGNKTVKTYTVPGKDGENVTTGIKDNVPDGYQIVTGSNTPDTVTLTSDRTINVPVEQKETPTTPTDETKKTTVTYIDNKTGETIDSYELTGKTGTSTNTKIEDNVPDGYTIVTGQNLPKTVDFNDKTPSTIPVKVEKKTEDHKLTITYVDEKTGTPVKTTTTTHQDGDKVKTNIDENVPTGYTKVPDPTLPTEVTMDGDKTITVKVTKNETPKEDHTLTITYVDEKTGDPVKTTTTTHQDGDKVKTNIDENVPTGYTKVPDPTLPTEVTMDGNKTITVKVTKNEEPTTPTEDHTLTITYVDEKTNTPVKTTTTTHQDGDKVKTNIDENVPTGYTKVPDPSLPTEVTMDGDKTVTVKVTKNETPKEDHTLTITYVDEKTGKSVKTTTTTHQDGDKVKTNIDENVPDGYTKVPDPSLPTEVTMDGNKTITVEVTKNETPKEDHTLTVTYVDQNGNKVVKTYTVTGKDGEEVTTGIKDNVPDGYTIVTKNTPDKVTLTGDKTITVEVTKNETPKEDHTLTVNYVDQNGNKTVKTYTVTGKDGNTVTTKIKDNVPDGYTIVSNNTPDTVTLTSDKTINVPVAKEHTLTVTYVDQNGNKTVKTYTVTGKDGDKVTTGIKDNVPDGYTIVTDNTPNTVTLTDDKTITVEVKKNETPTPETKTTTVTYVDKKTGETVGSYELTGKTGTSTSSKIDDNVPDGYQIVTGQDLPKTVTFDDKTPTTIPVTVEKKQTSDLTITYVDKKTGKKITTTTTSYPTGTTVKTAVDENVPTGYQVVNGKDIPTEVTMNGNQTITVELEQTATLTVTYVDQDGNKVVKTYTVTGTDGGDVTTGIKDNVPDGYTIVTKNTPDTVTLNGDQTITIKVQKTSGSETPTTEEHTLTVTYVDQNGNQVVKTYKVTGKDGEEVTTGITANVPTGYQIVTGQDLPTTLTLTGDQTITVKVAKEGQASTTTPAAGNQGGTTGKANKSQTGNTETTKLTSPATPSQAAAKSAAPASASATTAKDQAAQLPQTGNENPAAAAGLGLAGLFGALAALGAKRKRQN